MGLVPWKLNNTGNQIGYSGCQYCFCQRIPDVIRKAADEHINEKRKLLFCRLKDRTYTVYHGCYDDLEGFTKRDICQFIREEEKDFSQGSIVFAPSLLHRYHEISGKDDSHMGCQGIIKSLRHRSKRQLSCNKSMKKANRHHDLLKILDTGTTVWMDKCKVFTIIPPKPCTYRLQHCFQTLV